jgi:hypothetical protein
MSQEPAMSYEREFGEMRAGLEGLRREFSDFRDEQRAWQRRFEDSMASIIDGHQGRLARLERYRSWLTGVAAAVGVFSAFMFTLAKALFLGDK